MSSKPLLYALLTVAALAAVGALYFYLQPAAEEIATPTPIIEEVVVEPELVRNERIIGKSVEGRDISAVTFGDGATHLLFVGGIHGGYEWNSSLLAYELIDHIASTTDFLPADLTLTIIPDLNPDGTALVTGVDGRFTATDIADPSTRVPEGRFNANDVDLNRNFACKWAPESTWRGEVVSAGTAAFSEPEAAALRDFVLSTQPETVVFWHSQAGNVYASECEDGILPETLTLMSTYAKAAGYGEVPKFDAYPITGDAEGWLASVGIPAVTVELERFNSIEWTRNLAGVEAVLTEFVK
ncbi:M14 family metallopeptidase [Candidatus Pacebacteria bacterium]|nr:M14 family metallopeptidase [Candidatus Paceibacterota bacterium]